MNPLVFHIVSGDAFFSGVALVLLAVVTSIRSGRWVQRGVALSLCLGLTAIAISSTPLPYWFYAIAAAVTLVWIISRSQRGWRLERWRRQAAWATVVIWLGAVLVELPYHSSPTLSPAEMRDLTVIGDSLTAGIGGEGDNTWPQILARQCDLKVQVIARAGATAASTTAALQQREIAAPVVLLEIGGNDLLGSTTAAGFARSLDGLLARLERPHRQVVMLELPLPPFFHEYGRIQRRLAARHGVALVPKRRFLSVLAGDGATLDGLHLSPTGHARMAAQMWDVLKTAFPPGTGN